MIIIESIVIKNAFVRKEFYERGNHMTSRERMMHVAKGEKTDRIPFTPTILEHSAKLISITPSQAAQDELLLASAHISAYRLYRHDLVMVGIDVYNIEAEALGCKIKYHQSNSIPGIINHPYQNTNRYKDIHFSKQNGRISMLMKAASQVLYTIGHEVPVSIGISGPFSIAVDLVGYENMLYGCLDDSEWVDELLQKVLEHQKQYCSEIKKVEAGVTVFESWATPPVISPDMYKEIVMPYEKELISHIKSIGFASAPLVIGGDTSVIVDDILETGTTLLVADYMVDIKEYVKKASEKGIVLRGNIDPKLVESGTQNNIIMSVENIIQKVDHYNKFILGTGVIPYNTPAEHIELIRSQLEII